MAEITFGSLKEFVFKHGNIRIIDLTGETRILTSGVPDYFELAEKANRFYYDGHWYSREGFSKLMDELSSQKGP